ncbi:hypothetical protein B0H14DRAFT_2603853 [Mycena olivaceomarginata]|nr:hypothetical protein B0H14DRAFT_2603853 [Mycena olivaceomarginata]
MCSHLKADELQARVDAARAAKKVTDQTVKDVQTALSAAKGTSVRRKSGKGKTTVSGDILLFPGLVLRTCALSSAHLTDSNCFYLVLSSAISNVEQDLPPIIAQILALQFINPPLAPVPAPVDFALPLDFSDDLVWLDNLGFMSETSQPLNVSLNSVSLVNTVPINNPEGTEFQFDANGELDWFFANMSQGGDDFTAALSQLNWNVRRPDSFDLSSSTGTRGINFEGWDTDIVFTECVLETVGTAVQSKAKKPKSKRIHVFSNTWQI